MSNATQINNTAYRALVQASNAAHRNAERATMATKAIEAQIAQLRLALDAARDAERLAQSHADAIDEAIEKIDAGLDAEIAKIENGA